MNPTRHVSSARRRCIALVGALSALLPSLPAQTTVAAPTAAQLAKYDQNKNGILDADELAQMQSDEARSGAIVLTPFEVSTDKDVGYAAGNTLSGGRVDTPLAITPGSISVMTKEFMDDFNITNINDAGAWTIGFDLGTPVPNSNPSAISAYQNIVRGAPSDQNFPTRNGSVNFGIADSYNTERFEFNRGPDTSMFGDGGPGGRQSSSSKRARFNSTATTLMTQFDFGYNGYRGTLDYSKGWDRFGLRVNSLYQNNKAYQDSVDRFKKAITVNGVVKLTKNTLFIAEYEKVNEWNNLYSITYGDMHNLWDGVTVNANNTPIAGNVGAALTNLGIEQFSATADYFVWNYGIGEFQNMKGNQYRTRGIGTNYRVPFRGNPNNPKTPTPTLPGISKRANLAPKNNIAARDTDTVSFTVEHRVGNLFAQLGFVQNHYDINTIWTNGSTNEYRIDINRLMPDGRPNPMYLRAFADQGQNRLYNEDRIREFKGLATYRFFVPKFFDYKQQLSFNTGYRETHNEARSDSWRRADNPLLPDPTNSANQIRMRLYFDAPRADLAPVFTDPNKVMPGKWIIFEDSGNITERTVKYAGLVSQSAFFNEKLALTASIRTDDVAVDNLPRFGSTPDYKNLLGFGAPGVHFKRNEKVTSASYGLVTYPLQLTPEAASRIGGIRKWISPIGFVFNYAENTQPPGTGSSAPLIDGTPAPLTHAKTMDLGLRYSVPGGKAYLTVSHYNTDSQDIVSGFGSLTDIRAIWLNLGYNDPALTTSSFNYSDVSSRKLEGWEAELTANPTRNLTLTANYSHPLSYIQSESVGRKAYVAAHRAEWDAGAAAVTGQVINGKTIQNPQLIKDALLNIDNSLTGLTTGTLDETSTRHRINFAASYRFREGQLKGLGINYGVNYKTFTKTGSRDARIKFGLPDSVTPTALQNAQAAFDYLWAPPTIVQTAGVNYTRRIGKYNTRFQINIANLTDNDHPIWGRNGASGAYTTIPANMLLNGNPRMQVLSNFTQYEPRKITFTTTVSF